MTSRRARHLILFAGLAVAAVFAERRSAVIDITAVRFWSLGDVTRIAIEAGSSFQYHSETLQNPDRVFFDIEGARVRINGRRYYSKDVGDKLIKRIRMAETSPGVTRVVIDLEKPVTYTLSELSYPDRLIIELHPAAPQPELSAPPEIAAAKPDLKPSPVSTIVNAPPEPGVPRRAGSSSHSLTRTLGLKINRVVLDPGHGGQDQGTVGANGLMEKELVLDVALRLGKLIEQRMGSEVIYTRTGDTFIPLQARTRLANEKKADLFLSIHANSSPSQKVAGIETFYLNLTGSPDALEVAARENAASDRSVYELRDLLRSITLNDKIEESREFATRIQNALYSFAARYSVAEKNRGVKQAPFVVLIGASMPSVLAEIGFVTNAHEANLLMKSEHRQKLAEALYRGVSKYAQTLSHFQVAQRAGE